MRFESLPPDPPLRLERYYDVIERQGQLVFIIESLDILPQSPRFWCEGLTGVLHHGPQRLVILPNLSRDLRDQILNFDFITIEEKHDRHFNQGITPWGMDRVGPALLYEVPVMPIPADLNLKDSFEGK